MNDSLMIGKILTISLKENIVFVKLFETSFASDILALFTDFNCEHTNPFFYLFKFKFLTFEM